MRRALAAAAVAAAAAVVLGGAHGCQGTDPSANPLKPCPIGQVRRIANARPPFEYKCYPALTHMTTTHRKKRR